jgi:peptidoglycan/xylan/chitin deacetylase (PgdA/CDA1 family)
MRWAVAAGALAITAFVAVLGFLIWSHPELRQRLAATAMASQEKPAAARDGAQVVPPTHVSAAADASADQAFAQSTTVASLASPNAIPSAAHHVEPSCSNPNALGVSRTVEIDTTGGPGFGFEHFKQHDFLRPGEVVLTFDDGPWPGRTSEVLAALAAHCTKAVFFPIGKNAVAEPWLLQQVAAAGHTIGSHTWSHKNLARKGAHLEDGKAEIEKGISAVAWAVGHPAAPFFRFPALRHPPELVEYLGQRNIAIFSTDLDSFDFRIRQPEHVRESVLAKLQRHGKGIILMHDFQQSTAAAAIGLLADLKAAGYRVVHMRAKDPVATLPTYDEEVRTNHRLPTVSLRPTDTVVRTVE